VADFSISSCVEWSNSATRQLQKYKLRTYGRRKDDSTKTASQFVLFTYYQGWAAGVLFPIEGTIHSGCRICDGKIASSVYCVNTGRGARGDGRSPLSFYSILFHSILL
jgi:hypothetical protein